jgi:hypothetical protein
VSLKSRKGGTAPPPTAEILEWRCARLRRAGFDSESAEWLSSGSRVDLHALIELVERGCPPPLAVRILAPLDYDGGDR